MAENISINWAGLAIGQGCGGCYDILSKDVAKIIRGQRVDFETKHLTLFYLSAGATASALWEIAD